MRGVVSVAILCQFLLQHVKTHVNIALAHRAFMSSVLYNQEASLGNDGNYETYFHTGKDRPSWWAVDFGLNGQLVTWVRVTNRHHPKYAKRLKKFTIGLTDEAPSRRKDPLLSPFHKCASHGEMESGETVDFICTDPFNSRGRYLFLSASTTDGVFNLAEIEVFSVMDAAMTQMTGYRNDYNVTAIIDQNNATCEPVTTPESNEAFQLKYEMPNVHSNLMVALVLDGGDCLDFPATMVYTEGDRSAMLPYHNNPSFCDLVPGMCVFECTCSEKPCNFVNIAILSAPDHARKLCEVTIT